MDTDSWGKILILGVLIIFSAFFSASETAFSSLNRIRLKTMADDGNKRAGQTLATAESFDKLLSAVLIGNNIVNIASSAIATTLFVSIIGNNATGATVSTVVMTAVVLIFGEVTPKSIAKEMPERFAMFATPILKAFMIILTPAVAFFVLWKKMLKKVFRLSADETITGDELINIVDEAESGGGIDEGESELIKSAISFGDCVAGDIFTPRVDVVAVSTDDDIKEIGEEFDRSGYSRLPVYRESIDDIIGFIHIRDFTKYVLTGKKKLKSVLRKTVYVAKQMPVDELLSLMQNEKTHMAVVSDEYGGTIGIVTMEDILEELVGEIWDEYDEVVDDITVLSEGEYLINGSAQLDKMFEELGIPEDENCESSTVGGWASEKLGKIADEGDVFEYENMVGTVAETDNRRVISLRVTVTSENSDD